MYTCIHVCLEKFLRKAVELGITKKGLEQVADIQGSALLHPYILQFDMLTYIGISCPVPRQNEVGMEKCTA